MVVRTEKEKKNTTTTTRHTGDQPIRPRAVGSSRMAISFVMNLGTDAPSAFRCKSASSKSNSSSSAI